MTSLAVSVAPYAVRPCDSRRMGGVSAGMRLSAAIFGSPSARRANGGAEASVVPAALRTRVWYRRRAQTPVFEVDRRGAEASERLPRVWVTEPAYDARTGAYVGREYVGVYPSGPDEGGWRAFEAAERYSGEAAACDQARKSLRVECFRAAEILYLHAAQRGNVEAYMKLAGLYLGDACCGRYWKGALEERARHYASFTPVERGIAWLFRAAEHGHAQACCRLGDMLAEGKSCAQDPARAYGLFRRAYDVAAFEGESAQAGAAALRLATCHERGRGCAFSFEVAQSWYRIGVEHLQEAFDEGAWGVKRDLDRARKGARRMAQEISGLY
ncbi:MAG: hypothetical protein Q4C41_06890 [Eggerthellaceae bacterium]|nr:hypothetical protein [Eggerthellaceae bacterium]